MNSNIHKIATDMPKGYKKKREERNINLIDEIYEWGRKKEGKKEIKLCT